MEERFLVLLLKLDSFLDFFFRALHSLSFPKLLTDLEVWSNRRAASLILCLLYFLSFSSWAFNCLFSSLYCLLTISEFSSSDKTLPYCIFYCWNFFTASSDHVCIFLMRYRSCYISSLRPVFIPFICFIFNESLSFCSKMWDTSVVDPRRL